MTKKILLEVRAMPKEDLERFDGGRWRRAFKISNGNWVYNVAPSTKIGELVDHIKGINNEI